MNRRVDKATEEEPAQAVDYELRRPYTLLPPQKVGDHAQLSGKGLKAYLHGTAAEEWRMERGIQWGPEVVEGGGIPLDWLTSTYGLFVVKIRTQSLPTMDVLAYRQERMGVDLDNTCLLCGEAAETWTHVWTCRAMTHEVGKAREGMARWLRRALPSDEKAKKKQEALWRDMTNTQTYVLWSQAITTKSMIEAGLTTGERTSKGTRFLIYAVQQSRKVYLARSRKGTEAVRNLPGRPASMAELMRRLTAGNAMHDPEERGGQAR